MIETFIIDNNDDENKRLDLFVLSKKPNVSRSWIQKIIEQGNIFVNNKITKTGYKIKFGDKIDVNFNDPVYVENNITPENIPLEILYEDNFLIVINKTHGMVVHPAPGNYHGTLVNALLWHCKDLSGNNNPTRPGIVHRLDKDTSGLMVIAKNDFTHQKLQEQWQLRKVNRKYFALVHGIFTQTKFMVNAPIGRDSKDRQKMAVTDKNSRFAITHFEIIKKFKKHSIVQAKLDTGRTHQVRVHLCFIKHPVVGDVIYGSKKDTNIISRQALHSALLGFVHPGLNKYIEFESPMPLDMQDAIKKMQ